MKKFILFTSLFILVQNAFAQVKVLSNGNVAIQSSGTALSPISINSTGSPIFTCMAKQMTEVVYT